MLKCSLIKSTINLPLSDIVCISWSANSFWIYFDVLRDIGILKSSVSTWVEWIHFYFDINDWITTRVCPEGDYPFNLQIGYSTKQDSSYYIYNIHIDLNRRKQKISEIVRTIVDQIMSWEYLPRDLDVSFNCMEGSRYLYLHSTMSVDTNFTFYLMGD
jgi:hypothetical protein